MLLSSFLELLWCLLSSDQWPSSSWLPCSVQHTVEGSLIWEEVEIVLSGRQKISNFHYAPSLEMGRRGLGQGKEAYSAGDQTGGDAGEWGMIPGSLLLFTMALPLFGLSRECPCSQPSWASQAAHGFNPHVLAATHRLYQFTAFPAPTCCFHAWHMSSAPHGPVPCIPRYPATIKVRRETARVPGAKSANGIS